MNKGESVYKMVRKNFWRLIWTLGAFFSIVIILNATFMPGFVRNKSNLILNPIYIIAEVGVIILGIYAFYRFFRNNSNIKYAYLVLMAFQLFLQIYLSFHMQGAQGVDDFDVRNQAEYLARGVYKWSNYFSFAPNNVGTTIIYSRVIKFGLRIGISNSTLLVNMFNFCCIDLAAYCGWWILKREFPKQFDKDIYLVVCVLFFPLFLPALIMYTDPLALTFVTIAMYFFKNVELQSKLLNKTIFFILGSSFSSLAVFCKTNAVIFLIAYVLYILFKKVSLKAASISIILLLGIYGICNFGYKNIENNYDFKVQESTRFPYVYWIAMGLNDQTDGTNHKSNIDTWAITNQYHTPKARATFDQQLIKKEIKEMGFFGIINLWARKINIQWSLGTIGAESRNYSILSRPSAIYKYVYGFKSILLFSFSQAIYLILWIGFLFRSLKCLKSLKSNKLSNLGIEGLIVLFTIGIITFHMVLWETQERYAYLVAVALLVVGSSGIKDIFEKVDTLLNNKSKEKLSLLTKILIFSMFFGFAFEISNFREYMTSSTPILGQNFFRKQSLILKPHETLTERIRPKDYFDNIETSIINVDNQDKITVKLVKGKKAKDITNSMITYSGGPGNYLLKVSNKSDNSVSIPVVRSISSDLLQEPIEHHQHSFLGIQLNENTVSPKIEKSLYLTYTFLLIVGMFLSIRVIKIKLNEQK